jgi:hypothetical protein
MKDKFTGGQMDCRTEAMISRAGMQLPGYDFDGQVRGNRSSNAAHSIRR